MSSAIRAGLFRKALAKEKHGRAKSPMDGSGGSSSSFVMVSEEMSGNVVAIWLQSFVFIRNLLEK